jgi:DNA-binding response OmpR family regulator
MGERTPAHSDTPGLRISAGTLADPGLYARGCRADTGQVSRKTILIVDDQPHTRAFIRAVLERQGCLVLEAGDEATAWEVVKTSKAPVSLALIDVELPGLGGSDVSQILQTVRPVPVLFMSGYEREGLVADGKLSASAEMLAKPFTVNGLIAAIEARLAAA